MRACFLGQNVCALGFGVATVQSQRLIAPVEEHTSNGVPDISDMEAPLPLEKPMQRALHRHLATAS